MITLAGSNALSANRAQKLLVRLQDIDSNVSSIQARFIHFVDVNPAITPESKNRLASLLEYGEPFVKNEPDNTSDKNILEIFVIPRLGTISIWSSRATDIAHNCSIEHVRRIERGIAYYISLNEPAASLADERKAAIAKVLHDRMTETVLFDKAALQAIFEEITPQPVQYVSTTAHGREALAKANAEMNLALSEDEVDYLYDAYVKLDRDPTDVELIMFAQVNSEHCRHKIFNADWTIDSQSQDISLFGMIRNTHAKHPGGTLVAYTDNSSVMEGASVTRFYPRGEAGGYTYEASEELTHILMKVETHNHPTSVSPFPSASTGAGGEIRDEGATGRGASPKVGLTGFTVSNLMLPGATRPWESVADVTGANARQAAQKGAEATIYGRPDKQASSLQIMLEAPVGGADFNNAFGRPNLTGYFRSYEQNVKGRVFGYHKPIMIAGGIGNISDKHLYKHDLPPGSLLIHLGGPGMLIGMGGGAASSLEASAGKEELDFDSVQRGNPEMGRRAQEVVNACWAMGENNPILSIHDVGAGGLSNALPEMAHDSSRGATFDFRSIPLAYGSMSPAEIWSNESQERYVLAIDPQNLPLFQKICERERCGFAVVGTVTEERQLKLIDTEQKIDLVDMPMDLILGKLPTMHRQVTRLVNEYPPISFEGLDLEQTAKWILQLPTVGSKAFLITIGDRSGGGLITRDQMVGPWQVPVADCAVTLMSYDGYAGEAMAMGERTPLAVINAPASGRIAIGEAITNIAAAPIRSISDIKLSANWMAACGHEGQDAALFDTVKAVGMELCPALGISIPVGKDSLSMRTTWEEGDEQKAVISPISLIVSAFAPVPDVRSTLTPQLRTDEEDTVLLLIDLGRGKNRLGASAFAQVTSQIGNVVPDVDNPEDLRAFFATIQELNQQNRLLAYHDRSDGGLFVTLCEMAFASRTGLKITLDSLLQAQTGAGAGQKTQDALFQVLFAEELGAVIQVRAKELDAVKAVLDRQNLLAATHEIGTIAKDLNLTLTAEGAQIRAWPVAELKRIWSETSWRITRIRDNPDCADREYAHIADMTDPGISLKVPFDAQQNIAAPFIATGVRPKVAILREQGSNSQVETAYVMHKAGFTAVDVHMSDLMASRTALTDFRGIVAVGGATYGNVLGAGMGWARTILFNPELKDAFSAFFARNDTFALGICNGAQMLCHLGSIIPGAQDWPLFTQNVSDQFEGRFVMVEVLDSPSLFFDGMKGLQAPVPVASREGFANFALNGDVDRVHVAMRYVDHYGKSTEAYPLNPFGTPQGITALTTEDGRFTVMMPHAQRVFRTIQNSWSPSTKEEYSPWMRMFFNARKWVG